jgi:transcriptional regulator with XRE-family HTH domain
MSRHSKTAFTFGPELRARLRQLRVRRGLSLRAMAVLMDRQSPGAHAQLSRLERGAMPYPPFNFIVDYLRACGAGFEDLLDLLKPHTSQPPILRQKADAAVAEILKSLPKAEQRAMLRWEKATTEKREERAAAEPAKKKPRVETSRQRVFRVIWSFIHANWNEVFEQKLYEAMRELKDEVPKSERKYACNYGRRFFGILTRYYRQETRRKGALARVEESAKQHGFSTRVVAKLRDAADQAYRELLGSGRLDWAPSQEEIIKNRGHAPKVEKAETRLEIDEARPTEESNKTLALVEALAIQEVGGRLDDMKLAHYHGQEYYFMWIRELVAIAYAHGTDSPEWKASVEQWVPKLQFPEYAREAAKTVADLYNRWKVKLPPKQKGVNEKVG